MVTAADFAAYSRATGTPYPQSAQERAELFPKVRDFRQNQLRSDEQESFDPVQAVGRGLVGLGVVGGLGGLAFKGAQALRNRGAAQASSSVATQAAPKRGRGPNAGSARANAGSQVVDIDSTPVNPNQAAASNPVTDSFVQDQVQSPNTVNPVAQSEVVNSAQQGADAKMRSLQSNPRITYALGEASVDVAKSADGFNFDAFFESTPANQVGLDASENKAQRMANNAVQSLVQQQDLREPQVESQSTAAVDSARNQYEMDAFSTEQMITDGGTDRGAGYDRVSSKSGSLVEGGLTERQQRMMQDFAYTGSDVGPKKASLQDLLADDMSGGLSDRQLADPVVQQMLNERSSGTNTAFSLTGDVRDLPTADGRLVRELSKSEQKELLGGRPRANMFTSTNLTTAERERRSPGGMRPDPAGFAADMKKEMIDRISAASSLGESAGDEVLRQQLLDPNIGKDKVQTLLGSTMREVRGRVGTNMQQEITEGAKASFGRGDLSNNDPEMLARKVQIGDDMYIVDDDNPFVAREAGQSFDPYGAEGLASAEGVGGIVDTETFRERTNKATTEVPGSVMEAVGGPIDRTGRRSVSDNRDLYLRMERAEDQQLPVRRAEGEYDPSRGIFVDPVTGATRLDKQGYRDFGKVQSDDLNAQGTRLTGGFEPSAGEPSQYITEEPLQRERLFGRGVDERIETIEGVPYVMSSKNVVDGSAPLRGRLATRTQNPDGSTGMTFLDSTPYVDFQLDRGKVKQILDDAIYDYANNPSMKKAFLEQFKPSELAEGVASGKLLSEIGDGATRNDFLIGRLRDELLAQGVDIPVLATKENRYGLYHDTASHQFLNSLLGTTKETAKYGSRAATNPDGSIKYDFVKKGSSMVRTPVAMGEATEIPSSRKVAGEGGVDPMTIGDDYADMDNVAFYTPRIETAPQVVRDARTGAVLSTSSSSARPAMPESAVGAKMRGLRSEMETAPSERRVPYVSNLGGGMSANSQAIANTRRPYTGLANPAYGSRFTPVIDNEPANRDLSYMQSQPAVDPISSVGENDVSIMMDRLRAQAGRRSGSRRN